MLILLSLGALVGACASAGSETASRETLVNQAPDGGDVQDIAKDDDVAVSEPEEGASERKEAAPMANAKATDGAPNPASPDVSSVPIPKKRMIQRDGRFVLESVDPVKTQKAIEKAVKESEGIVLESNRRTNSNEIRGTQSVTMTLRVPAEKFDGSLDGIRKAADRVVSEQIKGKDVTEKYVDIQARLKAKRALEAQFLEIMKQAKSVQDAMNVQRQLASVRSEIERIEGQKRLLESLTSMSTIRITINPPNAVSTSGTGFWYELQDAIGDGIEAALTFVLFLVRVGIAVIPFLLVFVLPLALIARWLWKKAKRNRMAREIIKNAESESDDEK